jgi:hypothetical protein
MRRLVWVSLGAAGGILVYRKAQEMISIAKDKGVLLTVTDTTTAIKEFAQGAGQQISRLKDTPTPVHSITGMAAATVRSQPKQ